MSDGTKKVSVIVPVYNVEKELEQCVESLIHQTYRNIEIILVNDGSPDQCPKMCDMYQLQDPRIKVIHKENGGLSSARNKGLDIASGDYISFVDSDDWVADDFIETLLDNAEKENADISIIGYTMVWNSGKSRRFSYDEQYFVFDTEQAVRELLIQEKFQCMVCQKMYRASIFKSVRFPEGKLYEDVAVSLSTFLKANKVVVCGKSKYYYYQRNGSIANSSFNKDKLFFLECCRAIIEYSDTCSGLYDKEAHTFYLRTLMVFLLQVYEAREDKPGNQLCRELTREIVNEKKYIWNNPYLELRKKIVLTLMALHFPPAILLKLWKKRVGS